MAICSNVLEQNYKSAQNLMHNLPNTHAFECSLGLGLTLDIIAHALLHSPNRWQLVHCWAMVILYILRQPPHARWQTAVCIIGIKLQNVAWACAF